MKIIQYTLTIATFSLISCGKKDEKVVTTEKSAAVEQNKQVESKIVGEWTQVGGDNTISFISQGNSLLFNDGVKNFKAELSGDKSVNVDLSSMSLGIVVFEYSAENDTISAMGDTFSRKE